LVFGLLFGEFELWHYGTASTQCHHRKGQTPGDKFRKIR
jgi:hypothetical protein